MDVAPPNHGSRILLFTLAAGILGGIFLGSSAFAVEFTLEREIDFIQAEGFGPDGAPVEVGDRIRVTIRYNETVSPTILDPEPGDATLGALFDAFPFLSVELIDVPTVLSGFGGRSGGIAVIDNDPVDGTDTVKDGFNASLSTSFGMVIEGTAFGDTPDWLSVALSSFGPIGGPFPDLIEGLDAAPLPPFDPDELSIGIQYFNDQNEVERSLFLQSGGEGIRVPEPSATISLIFALASVFLVAGLRRSRFEPRSKPDGSPIAAR